MGKKWKTRDGECKEEMMITDDDFQQCLHNLGITSKVCWIELVYKLNFCIQTSFGPHFHYFVIKSV